MISSRIRTRFLPNLFEVVVPGFECFPGAGVQRLRDGSLTMSILSVRRCVLPRSETGTTNIFLLDKLTFGSPGPFGERACVGARLKIQAKAKLDQISEIPGATRERGSGHEAGGLESIYRGEPQLRSVAMG